MELTVVERLVLLGLLPSEGDLTTLRIVRELREALSFDEEEHERLQFKHEEGRVAWRNDDSAKAINLGAKATRLIVERLEALDAVGKLTEQHLTLCDKFAIGG